MMTVYKTKWYLVRSDRTQRPWEFHVLTQPFPSMKAARMHAQKHQLDNYRPWRGQEVRERVGAQADQAIKVIWENSP